MRDSIANYMTLIKLFSDAQYGFRSLRSCALQLLDLMETWTDWIDEGTNFDCIYYHFAKVFDSVPDARLLVKLESYGIKGKLLEWIYFWYTLTTLKTLLRLFTDDTKLFGHINSDSDIEE